MTDQEYGIWVLGTLNGIGAPNNPINQDTLWAWSSAEGGRVHMNPLNTTWNMPGATPWNTLSNGSHVWTFADVQDAITATVLTLLNGPYPTIVDHLIDSVPRQAWADACGELNTWGTGCGWLNTYYGAAPGTIGGTDLTQDEHNMLLALYNVFGGMQPNSMLELFNVFGGFPANGMVNLQNDINTIKQSLSSLGAGGGLNSTQAQELSDVAAAITRIEAALKGA